MSPRPYRSAAKAYLVAGYWPLPLPPRKKASPPEGYTGRNGNEVSAEDVHRWIAEHPSGNIALRLPPGIIGIDLDLYEDPTKDHPAAERQAAWRELVGKVGPLPESPRSTSRDDGISGIRLYRVPADWKGTGILPAAPVCEGHPLPDGRQAMPGDPVSPGELIQYHHRYMVAPPSIHLSGRLYRWYEGDLPAVSDLPFLERP